MRMGASSSVSWNTTSSRLCEFSRIVLLRSGMTLAGILMVTVWCVLSVCPT